MVRKALVTVTLALALAGCASTAMKRFVGGSVSEAYMAYGRPENVFDLPDGRRAFQFYWGGGTVAVPAQSNSTITGNPQFGYHITTTSTPATFIDNKGCLVTLIARPRGNDFVVEEYRIPKRLTC